MIPLAAIRACARRAVHAASTPNVRFVLSSFAACRAALFVAVFFSLNLFPDAPEREGSGVPFGPAHYFWNSFARWDSDWYARIAEHGYYLEGTQSDVAFFPGFPLLARGLGPLFGSHWAAGLIVTNASLLGALLFLHAIARRYLDDDGANRTVLAALCFPGTYFYSCYYSEGLFFFAVCGAFYFYERGWLLPAALFGALASFTRSTGVFLLPALGIGTIHRWGWRTLWPPRKKVLALAWLALIGGGLAAFMLILARTPGVADPLAWMNAQAGWGRSWKNPVSTLWDEARSIRLEWLRPRTSDSIRVMRVLDWFGTSAIWGAAVVVARRFDLGHGIFAVAVVSAALWSGRSLSMLRFALGVPAVFLVVATLAAKPAAWRPWLFVSSMLAALLACAFASWRFAG